MALKTIKSVVLSDKPHIWEINKAMYKSFKEYHFVGYDYRKHKPKTFLGADLPKMMRQDTSIMAAATYVEHIYSNIRNNSVPLFLGAINEIPELKEYERFIAKEAAQSEQDGELCIYCSILFYSLIKKTSRHYGKSVKYVQGFYKHDLREDFPSFIPFSKLQIGLHAFAIIDEVVFDLTIGQQDYFFDFKAEPPLIIGKAPEGLNLMGHIEIDCVVNKYVKKYAARAGIDPELWLLYHQKAAALHMIKTYEEIEDRVLKSIIK